MNDAKPSEAEPQKCLSCGAIIAPGTPENLCPACLLANAIGHTAEASAMENLSPETLRLAEAADDTPSEIPSERIGRYKLLQKIGEGGCGVVYMVEQTEPMRRRVALKVIKLGMDTKAVIARFEAERQALAMMDHPNIAKVFDAGATGTGRPFFVMELVKGIRITDYCDQNKLSTRERLELFTQVCKAIQHAHQKGIIHRDIKPSNILVTLHDGVPVPKVIDFGIAKATDQQLTDKTVVTAFGQFIGTPAYMSPEQAELSGLDIDTRTDIYSLGVLLYELLTGSTPFDASELIKRGLDEIRRTVREVEPPRPSIKLGTLTEANLTTVANARSTQSFKLRRQLRGDLDWVVMKALEKNRKRRYETASELASEIQRHLNDEPVTARPPSELYRLQKLIRRNKVRVVVGCALAVSVLFVGVMFLELVGLPGPAKYRNGYQLHAWFDNVQDLKRRDRVRISGVEVGYVDGIFLNETDGKVRVSMRMSFREAVKTDSVATIKSTATAGRNFVELKVGSPNAPRAVEGTYLLTAEEPASVSAKQKMPNMMKTQ